MALIIIFAAGMALALAAYQLYLRAQRNKTSKGAANHSCCSHSELANHTNTFDKKIIQVTDNILVAIGYGLANTICIRGDTGLIMVDTLETNQSAEEALRDIRKVEGYADLPVVGIVYTHFHSDHVGGTEAFLSEKEGDDHGQNNACQIWAHASTKERILQFNLAMGPIAYVRSARQFGMFLDKPMLENCGIGPNLRSGRDDECMSQILPTHEYGSHGEVRRLIQIAGVDIELIHSPGETDDQTVVYLPKYRLLCAADNFYESFPNLYAIRGVPHRDSRKWIESLDLMRGLNAEIMAPAHTLPVHGANDVSTRLRNYRDAIAYVHDQTVRLALKGEHPNTIANKIRLPTHLRGLQYLKEFYGTIHWSAKAIFAGYLGWFSGEAAELMQENPVVRAEHLIDLGGGAEKCVEVVESSISSGKLQWALELATAILDAQSTPGHVRWRAIKLRADALKRLGCNQISANARNYYFTSALETAGDLDLHIPQSKRVDAIMSAPIDELMQTMVYRVDSTKAEGQDRQLRINFVDTGRCFVLTLFNSVMTITSSGSSTIDDGRRIERDTSVAHSVAIECNEIIWRRMMANPMSLGKAVATGDFVFVQGGFLSFKRFMDCLDRSI